jgi:N-dimethylarginine dimethylaminohydrolase
MINHPPPTDLGLRQGQGHRRDKFGGKMYPRSLLMVSPKGFRVEYAINPHMLDSTGRLQRVDEEKAFLQWQRVQSVYQRLGLQVEVLEGDPAFPDMVFCANQSFPFVDQNGRKSLILSRMHDFERQGEVKHFRTWAESKGYVLYEATDFDFEGSGDAIWNFETQEIFGGYGFRTDKRVYGYIERIVGRPVHRLHLCDPRFYHLDTCLSILTSNTAVYVEEAFDSESLRRLADKFENLIRIRPEEAVNAFAGNCFSPNGKDVLLHPGARDLKEKLYRLGFQIHEVDTSEFIKAGGSVFCIKQTLF